MQNYLNYFSDTWLIFSLALFPLTYLAHIAEEYWGGGGYSDYLLRTHFVEMTPPRFLALQGLGLFLMLVGAFVSIPLRFPLTMLAILATIAFTNALVHIARSFFERNYTPGLFTAVLLWLPLGALTLVLVWTRMNAQRFFFAVIAGSAISLLVEVIAMRGGRLTIHRLH